MGARGGFGKHAAPRASQRIAAISKGPSAPRSNAAPGPQEPPQATRPPKGVTRREASLLRLAFRDFGSAFCASFPCLPPRAAGDLRSRAASRVFRALAVALASRRAPPENLRSCASSRVLKAPRSGVAARPQGASPQSAEIRADSRRALQTLQNARAPRAAREEGIISIVHCYD